MYLSTSSSIFYPPSPYVSINISHGTQSMQKCSNILQNGQTDLIYPNGLTWKTTEAYCEIGLYTQQD